MKFWEDFFLLKFLLGVDWVELYKVTIFDYLIRNALNTVII